MPKDLFIDPTWYKFPVKKACPQKILMVADGYTGFSVNISFSYSRFGLSGVINTLLDQSHYYVDFKLTLAHRQADSDGPYNTSDPLYARYGTNFENFRFTTTEEDTKTGKPFIINDYDQIWLFGLRSEFDDQVLDDDELALLTEWMENGGGLFAAGDHEDLGRSMCRRVPRASKMRLFDNVYDEDGNVIASPPDKDGPDRHDTLDKGHDDIYTFDDESDDVPMHITPKYYYSPGWGVLYQNKYPHPILCGKDGVIDILPDHPHEGVVVESSKVDISDTLVNGNPEFPKLNGQDYRPDVIAHAHVKHDHTDTSDVNKGAANAKTFGAIGVYDGYKTNVGRVVVDSTWHHWFDVNILGREQAILDTEPMNETNPKTKGFLATSLGQNHYSRIQNYYTNVAVWLAPKSDRLCMLTGAVWGYVLQYPVIERFKVETSIIDLGKMASDVLGREAGQCNVKELLIELIPTDLMEYFERLSELPKEQRITMPPEELIIIYLLGGVSRKLLELAYKFQDYSWRDKKAIKKAKRILDKELPKRVEEGIELGADLLLKDLERSLENTKNYIERLKKNSNFKDEISAKLRKQRKN